jgi:hypothetical protein
MTDILIQEKQLFCLLTPEDRGFLYYKEVVMSIIDNVNEVFHCIKVKLYPITLMPRINSAMGS